MLEIPVSGGGIQHCGEIGGRRRQQSPLGPTLSKHPLSHQTACYSLNVTPLNSFTLYYLLVLIFYFLFPPTPLLSAPISFSFTFPSICFSPFVHNYTALCTQVPITGTSSSFLLTPSNRKYYNRKIFNFRVCTWARYPKGTLLSTVHIPIPGCTQKKSTKPRPAQSFILPRPVENIRTQMPD